MATPLRGEAMAPRSRFHPPGRRTVMTTPCFLSWMSPRCSRSGLGWFRSLTVAALTGTCRYDSTSAVERTYRRRSRAATAMRRAPMTFAHNSQERDAADPGPAESVISDRCTCGAGCVMSTTRAGLRSLTARGRSVCSSVNSTSCISICVCATTGSGIFFASSDAWGNVTEMVRGNHAERDSMRSYSTSTRRTTDESGLRNSDHTGRKPCSALSPYTRCCGPWYGTRTT